MAGLYKPGQALAHHWGDAITMQKLGFPPPGKRQSYVDTTGSAWGAAVVKPHGMRKMPVVVLAEEQPGIYRCSTDMGVAILIEEQDLVS